MNSLDGDVDHGSLYDKSGISEIIVRAGEPEVVREVLAQGSGNDWPFPKFKDKKGQEPTYCGPKAIEAYRRSIDLEKDDWIRINIRPDIDHGSIDIRGYLDGVSFHGDAPKRRRGRPPSNARVLDQSGNLPIGSASEANTVQAYTECVSETLAYPNQPVLGEQPVKRRRGRPPKVKPLD